MSFYCKFEDYFCIFSFSSATICNGWYYKNCEIENCFWTEKREKQSINVVKNVFWVLLLILFLCSICGDGYPCFEISAVNADKPPLSISQIKDRVKQFKEVGELDCLCLSLQWLFPLFLVVLVHFCVCLM